MGFADSILWCAGTVSLNISSLSQGLFAQDGANNPQCLADGQVIAYSGTGNRFFEAIGVNKHVCHRAVDVGAHFDCELVIEQHDKL